MKSIGIVGAGISGLTMAYRLLKYSCLSKNKTIVDIYERNLVSGGRIHTNTCEDKKSGIRYHFDVGANLIDFQNQESQKDWYELLPDQVKSKMRKFVRPFLVWENGKMRKVDNDSKKNYKYYYDGGFYKLLEHLVLQIESRQTKICYGYEVVSLQVLESEEKVLLKMVDPQKQVIDKIYDEVFLSCPGPQILKIIQNTSTANKKNDQILSVMEFASKVQYTTQISIPFMTRSQSKHDFSCILFKNHPILSFICSHQQKYNENSLVVQTSEKFCQKYFRESSQDIAKIVYQCLPQQIKQMIEERSLAVHKWQISLVKPNENFKPVTLSKKNVKIIGDSLCNKSRVSNAVKSIKLMNQTSKL